MLKEEKELRKWTNNLEKIGKYLSVQKLDGMPNGVSFIVRSTKGDALGVVEWYRPWRKHVFAPEEIAVFDEGCLSDISAFLKRCDAAMPLKGGKRVKGEE